jgi:hypothetical protein
VRALLNEQVLGLCKLKELKISQRGACNKQKHDQAVDGSYSNALQ